MLLSVKAGSGIWKKQPIHTKFISREVSHAVLWFRFMASPNWISLMVLLIQFY